MAKAEKQPENAKQPGKPYYLSEDADEDTVAPEGTEEKDDDANEVELGSIQTNPGINYSEYKATGKGLLSSARVTPDGRIVISLRLKQALPDLPKDYANPVEETGIDTSHEPHIPPLNIVIMIVGSRGDVQPYVALAQGLMKAGHRVRIATHATFEDFVRDAGVEFFCAGGDPQELMSYMVRNPGLIPGFQSLTNGDIGKKRKMCAEMLDGFYASLTAPDTKTRKPFVADAIIANPPSFAHIHVAEALGLPLLMSFTMPWSATGAFPHPLVNVSTSNAEKALTNVLSFALAELLTWQGLGDVINTFRSKALGLPPLSIRSGAGVLDRLKIPYTYCISPGLIPKPDDWTNYIDLAGFYFLDLAKGYQPAEDLQKFLDAGDPPMYIGFGSVPVENPAKLTNLIFEATKQAGVRALLSAGWGGLGSGPPPDHIFILGNVPHDWLFSRCSIVCHHGGAGTAAAGLRAGRPTIVVPWFGDQLFWGQMIERQGAGPVPLPGRELSVDKLRDAIEFCKSEGVKEAAEEMGRQIHSEDGVENGVESFHRHLPLLNMRCDLDPSRVAVWWSNDYCLRMSSFAAQVLADSKQLDIKKLELHRPREYSTRKTAKDPITGGATAIFWTVTHYYAGIAQIFYSPVKGIINTVSAIPKGIMNIIENVHEGFQNLPRLYGSEIRQPGRVTDFESGLKEGAKSLFFGYYDAITGLVKEPVKGAEQEGFLGFIKGSGRSYANATLRPAAGIVGMIAHPMAGAWAQVQTSIGKRTDSSRIRTRQQEGQTAVKESKDSERRAVLARFAELKKDTETRRRALLEEGEKMLKDGGLGVEGAPSADTEEQTSDEGTQVSAPDKSLDKPTLNKPALPPRPQTSNPAEADEQFDRDTEIAKQISLAEQRGYERGLAQAKQNG
ncbi:glycosyltransferase family 1 protein [Calocera viscosa TUFC12733]|uniref:Glycosyltransferase family 1 protein n=1 Tax=Calocera viscosa (strain TUFC12733) TaxID=1330018 RepID=A0A167I8P8_CALVF|nr:glycosyltransferase family 1 protein [Calocera viscosa TUFC12733]